MEAGESLSSRPVWPREQVPRKVPKLHKSYLEKPTNQTKSIKQTNKQIKLCETISSLGTDAKSGPGWWDSMLASLIILEVGLEPGSGVGEADIHVLKCAPVGHLICIAPNIL